MKGCVSISLYGPAAMYAVGAIVNVHLARKFYPGWDVVIHAERGHYAIPRLRREGAQVIEHDAEPGSGGMFWRLETVDDERYTHVIIRDADSRIDARDAAATMEWIASGKAAHSLRDHWEHEAAPLLGGGWGVRVGVVKMAEALNWWSRREEYGDDEAFLGELVWPVIRDSVLRHTHNLVEDFEVAWPDVPHNWHFGHRHEASHHLKIRSVVLSPERYVKRRAGFFESLEAVKPCIGPVEWYRAKTIKERVVPCHADHAENLPHYYLASRDHVDIIERSILAGDEYLAIFEDDARFEPDFDEYFYRMLVALPEDWLGCMLGGAAWTDWARQHVDPPMPPALAAVRGCLGMHGVLWNRAGMIRAFDHFTYWNRMVIDQAFAGLQNDDHRFFAPAKWVVVVPPDVAQFGRDE